MAFRMQIYRPTSAYIDLVNLTHNLKLLKAGIGENNFFCPMVKANAYGHGDVEVALQLESEGVTHFGVGLIEEGLLLRQMGVKSELLVFGVFDVDGAVEIIRQKLTPVLSTWKQMESLEKVLKTEQYPVDVHIKFDTGMHRLGFECREADRVFQWLLARKNLLRVKGIATHLHSGEDASQNQGESHQQLRKFVDVENIFSPFKPISHSLNSSGLLNFIQMRKSGQGGLPGISLNQGARPGLSIYGYSPLAETSDSLPLRPVMSLRSQVVRFHQLNVGVGVSYGHSWRAKRKSIVGVVPIGYADGFHRLLSNKANVLFAGRKVPVAGNVCMDHLMLDLTDVFAESNLSFESWTQKVNPEVTLFGYDSLGNLLSAKEHAIQGQTIPWEILTSVGERVPRIIHGGDSRDLGKTRKELFG